MNAELWLVPAGIILAKFLFKLFIDRRIDSADFIAGLVALPVDIAFLAASLIAALTIVDAAHAKLGVGILLLTLCGGVVVIALWRRTEALFDKDKHIWTAVLCIGNYFISLVGAVYAVELLAKGTFT